MSAFTYQYEVIYDASNGNYQVVYNTPNPTPSSGTPSQGQATSNVGVNDPQGTTGDISPGGSVTVSKAGSAGLNGPYTYIGAATDANGSGYIIQNKASGKYYLVTNNPEATSSPTTGLGPNGTTDTSSAAAHNFSPNAPCFVSGTHIRTERGEIAVEDLRVGDRVVTASGAMRSITWLGHREAGGAGRPLHRDQLPVRVCAGATGPNVPARDVLLSPGHPVLVGADADGEGGYLVPVMCLINGTTIERVAVPSVTYWHVELDAHDILLAEGLPAESYLDWGDRTFFSEAELHALQNPDFIVPGLAGRCRPVAIDGPIVEAEQRRLDQVLATRLASAAAWPEGASAGDWAAA